MTRNLRVLIVATLFGLMTVAVLGTGCGPGPSAPGSEDGSDGFPVLTGEYLGQEPPGDEARLFAPGIVSTGMYERDLTMTPDGRELYYCLVLGNYERALIMVTRVENGRWTEPRVASFSGRYRDYEPSIAPDGRQLFFVSHRPLSPGGPPRKDSSIWVAERDGDGWGDPYPVGPPIDADGSEFFPSLTRDGTMYFTRDLGPGVSEIYRSRRIDGVYQEPERLGPEVNSTRAQFNAFISPDERYLIYGAVGREDSLGGTDYYVSFRGEDDTWVGPVSLGARVNSASTLEYSPYVSPDGRYLFFMASRSRFAEDGYEPPTGAADLARVHAEPRNGLPDIWWIDAGFIADLEPAGL